MPKIDYSIPDFTFQVGSFDATDYLDAIALSVPQFEPSQPLLWSGTFRLSLNLLARQRGLVDADFSPFDSPTIWRPGQQPIKLSIRGYDLPTLRIERYAYNPQTGVGEGTLTQILGLVAGDRPAVDLIKDYAGTPVSVSGLVSYALNAAFVKARVNHNGNLVSAGSGFYHGNLSTRDPVADAQKFASTSWDWISVDIYERLISVSGEPHGLVFYRTLDEVEVEPDYQNINFAASRVIVTGSRQAPDAAAVVIPPPRPKRVETDEKQPYSKVYALETIDDTPTLAERKIIIYQYLDDLSLTDLTGLGLSNAVLTELQYGIWSVSVTGTLAPEDYNQPIRTITIRRQPLGRVFPDAGVNANLICAQVIIESVSEKFTYAPYGVVFPDAGVNTNLVLDRREDMTSQYVRRVTYTAPSAAIDPRTGTVTAYEKTPDREPPQPAPDNPLKTEVIRGEARVDPVGWSPVRDTDLVLDWGFLPDKGTADYLAQQIAKREQRRRDAVQITMPIPEEWLDAGCPLLTNADIGGDIYQIDAPIVVMADGAAKFSFNGGLVSRSGSVLFGESIDCDLGFRIEVEVSLTDSIIFVELPPQIVDVSVITNLGVELLEPSIVDLAVITQSDVVTVDPLIVDVGIVVQNDVTIIEPSTVDVGIIAQADVSVAALPNVTLTVTPSTIMEGTDTGGGTLPNITLTVTPGTITEGT